jgi:hypothetical protein
LATDGYGFPARLEPDEEGRFFVHFPDLPEALTDGPTRRSRWRMPEARIVNADDIPWPSWRALGNTW